MDKIEFKKVLITPELATKLMQGNSLNRRKKTPHTLWLAKQMEEGHWREDTAETIKIAKTGRLLDGQHRLSAIILSGVSVYCYIAYGLEESVFSVIDTGSARNASDCFKIEGIKHDNALPSIISMYNLLLSGKRMGLQKNDKSTNTTLLNQYNLDKGLWQHVAEQSYIWYKAFAKILPPSYLGGFYAYFMTKNKELAQEFLSQLSTGIGITNDVVMILRNKLIQDKLTPRKMSPTLKMALIIKAWNVFVTNGTVKILKFDLVRDSFPTALSGNY